MSRKVAMKMGVLYANVKLMVKHDGESVLSESLKVPYM